MIIFDIIRLNIMRFVVAGNDYQTEGLVQIIHRTATSSHPAIHRNSCYCNDIPTGA
jgi:hypothetical protein